MTHLIAGALFADLVVSIFSCATELLEVRSGDPALHVLFIPGNPGNFPFLRASCLRLLVVLDLCLLMGIVALAWWL